MVRDRHPVPSWPSKRALNLGFLDIRPPNRVEARPVRIGAQVDRVGNVP